MREAVMWAMRLLLAGLFFYAGGQKILDPSAFALEISRYELLPQYAGYAAATLPAAELLVALGIVFFPAGLRRPAALAAAGMLVGFTAAAASAVLRGLDIECGCFGEGSGQVTWLTLGRNLVLLAVSIALVRQGPGFSARGASASRAPRT